MQRPPFPLGPELFENDLQIYDPAEIDRKYSAAYLAWRDELERHIAEIVRGSRP